MSNLVNLSKQISHQIESLYREPNVDQLFSTKNRPSDTPSPKLLKPIFQLNNLPFLIDIDLYRNALSPTNPEGSISQLFKFYELTDWIPLFQKNYFPSDKSIDKFYGQIVKFADVVNPNLSSLRVFLNDARLDYEKAGLDDLTGTGNKFHPVFGFPDDWWNPDASYSFAEITPNSPTPTSGLVILEGSTELGWGFEDSETFVKLDSSTIIRKIRFNFRLVQLRRPWLNPLILGLPGWKFIDMQEGYFSSGSFSENNGLMPLITTGFILAKDVEIEADWGESDKTIARKINEGNLRGYIGPFALGDGSGGVTKKELKSILSSKKILTKNNISINVKSGLMKPTDPDDPDDPLIPLPKPGKPVFPPQPLPITPSPSPSLSSKTIRYSGFQILGWISQLVPYCPQGLSSKK